jgi:hypothetical protein
MPELDTWHEAAEFAKAAAPPFPGRRLREPRKNLIGIAFAPVV